MTPIEPGEVLAIDGSLEIRMEMDKSVGHQRILLDNLPRHPLKRPL